MPEPDMQKGRALVASSRPSRKETGVAAPRPPAGFLAQLLAMRLDVPEYRQRRRSEPARAVAAYRAADLLA